MEYKIATHNSFTGEPPKNLLSFLLIPFSKCQSKTILEQYTAGCRFFDLRVAYDRKHDLFYTAHGLWRGKHTIEQALQLLNSFEEPVYVIITLENNQYDAAMFKTFILGLIDLYDNITLIEVNVKHPRWTLLWSSTVHPGCKLMFKPLDGTSWHTYLPIPLLWKKVFYDNVKFNNEVYQMVDFL